MAIVVVRRQHPSKEVAMVPRNALTVMGKVVYYKWETGTNAPTAMGLESVAYVAVLVNVLFVGAQATSKIMSAR